MLDLIIRNKRVLENGIYYLLSINYDFLIFRNLWFLRVSIENTYETQLAAAVYTAHRSARTAETSTT